MFTALLISLPAFGVACVLAFVLRRAGGILRILDHPGERSLHVTAVPRTGGLAIWAGCLTSITALLSVWGLGTATGWWVAAAAVAVGAISLLDDRVGVPVGPRLAVHVGAGLLLVWGGLGLASLHLPGVEVMPGRAASVVMTCLLVVWMTNLYNFMDGIDGLAGGMAVVGFTTLGVLALLAGDMAFAALCWSIAAAAGGFLVWNFPPADIFMGDSGASVLGLLAIALGLWADRLGLFPLWMTLLAFAPFVLDATMTLVQRTLKGERVWEAHRGHYYQRLVQAGLSHRRVTLWGYALMLICAGATLVAAQSTPDAQWVIVAGVVLLHVGAIAAVRRVEQRPSIPSID